MNFFEQELRKIIGQSTAAADASYVGRSCFVRLNPDLRAKLTFITMGIASHYEALKMTILNRKRERWTIQSSGSLTCWEKSR